MDGILLSVFAAVCASLSNLFVRKTANIHSSPYGHLTCHYFVSFLLCFFIFPNILKVPLSMPITCIGGSVGILNVVLMLLMCKALKQGPSGLTFALQNVSSIFPGVILFLLFGEEFGFDFTSTQALGIGLVIFGFFLTTKTRSGVSLSWFKYALGCFLIQVLALSLIQWRCLLFEFDKPSHLLLPPTLLPDTDIWFMPGLFGAAFFLQLVIFLREQRRLTQTEMGYGVLTGLANGLSTYLLSLATKWAGPQEQAILFPCFAVTTIILCNAWANKLYKEKFNIWANSTCALGVFIGS